MIEGIARINVNNGESEMEDRKILKCSRGQSSVAGSKCGISCKNIVYGKWFTYSFPDREMHPSSL